MTFPLLVLVKLLWNLKWKALLKLCKWVGVGCTTALVFSTIATRRYCSDDTAPAGAGFRAGGVGSLQNGTVHAAGGGGGVPRLFDVQSALQEVKAPSPSHVVRVSAGLTASNSSSSSNNSTQHTAKPMPVKVLLLSYYKGGSSFLGEIINRVKDAFHVVDPAAPIYTYMYGTSRDGVPAVYPNGTFRSPPPFESDLYGSAVSNMLNCHLRQLPTEFFTHHSRHAQQEQSRNVHRTCATSRPIVTFHKCLTTLPETCTQRENPSEWCHYEIEKVVGCFRVRDCSRYEVPGFFEHRQCLEDMYQTYVLPCMIPRMQKACDRAPVRLAQTVRLSMDAVRSLVAADPSVKVVHLVRDPRGILASREVTSPLLFITQLQRSASELCLSMLRDVRMREKLEANLEGFPPSFMQIKYEDMVSEPVLTTQTLYTFLGLPLPEGTKSWLLQAAHARPDTQGLTGVRRGNSTQTSLNWRNTLSYKDKGVIDKACHELLVHLKYGI